MKQKRPICPRGNNQTRAPSARLSIHTRTLDLSSSGCSSLGRERGSLLHHSGRRPRGILQRGASLGPNPSAFFSRSLSVRRTHPLPLFAAGPPPARRPTAIQGGGGCQRGYSRTTSSLVPFASQIVGFGPQFASYERTLGFVREMK